MKNNFKRILTASAALFVATSVFAQETAEVQPVAADSSLVNVAFRSISSQDVLGGIESVNIEQLMEKNSFNGALDNMHAYTSGFNGNSVWGFDSRVIVIDGVVGRNDNNIKPDEVESITILKGAQAVLLYGSHAAKGAILITTKRGKKGDIRIDGRVNFGVNVFKNYPEYVGAAEQMILYNKARENDGAKATYSPEEIYYTAEGSNPVRYPDVNLFSEDYLKKGYKRWDATVEINGGGETTTYYSQLSYYRVGSPFNFGKAKNDYVDRLSARGNIDAHLGDIVDAFANVTASYYNQSRVTGSSDFWTMACETRANKIQPLIPIDKLDTSVPSIADYLKTVRLIDGKYILAGVKTDLETNTIADMYAAGESTYTSRVMQFDTGVKIDLGGLTKGLSFSAVYGLDYRTTYRTDMTDEYATYQPTWSKFNGVELISALDKGTNNDKHSGTQNITASASNLLMSANVHFDYVRSFGDHNVNAIVLVNGDQLTESGTYHNDSEANFAAQVDYNYAHKYYLSLGTSVMHTAKLDESNRNHASKAIEIGADLAKQSFMEGGLFDKLLISAAASSIKTDLDISDYYMYSGNYKPGAWWSWGDEAGGEGTYAAQGGNPALDPQTRNELSVNVKAELLNRSLKIDASFYTNKYEGLIVRADNYVPSYFSAYYPETSFVYNMNYNENKRLGFDVSVDYTKMIGEVELGLGVHASYYKTEASKRDEMNEYSYQNRQGHDIDGNWGYECLGFFESEADINASPDQSALSSSIKPGDLKYKDQNGDKKIDSRDQVYLSRGGWYGDPVTVGTNITAKYKNFTLHVVGTGGFGAHAYKNNSYWCPKNDQRYSAEMRNAWTSPESVTSKTLPRLTAGDNANNSVASDFWEYKRDRFNIAKVQLTYDFSKEIFGESFVKGAQVYVSGSNLLTIAPEKEILEMNISSEPQSRYYNVGVKVSF